MDYCALNGCLLVILILLCTSEGLSTPNQSLPAGGRQHVQAVPREPEVPHADVAPVVIPPGLKEVQQVMQEASEKVEGHAAEEALKELLEKVVEAATGQEEGGGEAKGDEAAVQKAVTEEALGADKGDSDTKDVLEQAAEEKEVEGKDMGPQGGDAAAGKEQVGAEVDTFKDIAEEEESAKKAGVTAAGSVEETAAGVETGDGLEVIGESVDADVSQGEKGAAAETAGGDLTAQEADVEAKEPDETEPTLRAVEVALGGEQETAGEADPALVEQRGHVGGKEGAVAEESPAGEEEGDTVLSPSDRYDAETTNTVAGEGEHGVKPVSPATGPDAEHEEGGEGAEGASVAGAMAGGGDGRQQAGEEPRDHQTEHREVPALQVPDAEQSPAPTPSPSVGQKSPGDEESSRGNEIITPTDDPAAAARPALDHLATDVLAPGAQSGRSEAGRTNGRVDGAAGASEAGEPGPQAWKIGAICAAVVLIVETLVVASYVVKRRSQNSASACEDGRVEPEEATGGDCSDDTLPADNEQAATRAAPGVASDPARRHKEQRGAQQATPMSAAAGAEPRSSEELSTSTL